MTGARNGMIADLANHLSEEVGVIVARHLLVMEAGGATSLEASAAIMGALQSIAFMMLGPMMFHARPGGTDALLDTLVDQLAASLKARKEQYRVEMAKAAAAAGLAS